MIKYKKGIFGLNLLGRIHGSAIYRAIPVAILGSLLFLAYNSFIEKRQSELLHPYAAGVLIGGITFLLVFRVTQSYGRYWEATGAVYRMQSKWMDGTVHISNCHMQSSQYNKIRPPKYSDYHYLNQHRLTRDRERVRSSRMNLGTKGRISFRRAKKRSIEQVKLNGQRDKLVGMTPEEEPSISMEFGGVIPVVQTMVNKVVDTPKTRILGRRISSRRFESANNISSSEMKYESDDESLLGEIERPPHFLTGRPRTDGNWSGLFPDGKSTYMNLDSLSNIDRNGFASIQGGRTPILFLQELAHLASLLNAVALSTLRNDVEGVTSPLNLYIPGSAWPEVDPKMDEDLYDSKFEGRLYAFLYFLGQGRSPSERAKYNLARPLPVLGGVSDAEIQMLQMSRGPFAKTQMCFSWLSEFAIREFGDEVHGALLSRCMQFLSDGMLAYNDCRKIMFNPFPFPHAQISSFFVNFMWILLPLLMEQYIAKRWLGVLLTFLSVMCLTSIDEVARELENPFRNIPNELPVVTYQAEFNEALITMYAGFHPDSFWNAPPRSPHVAHTINRNNKIDLNAHNERIKASVKATNRNFTRRASWGPSQSSRNINEEMSTIVEKNESSEQGEESETGEELSVRWKDDIEIYGKSHAGNTNATSSPLTSKTSTKGDEKKNAQMRFIVEQQGRMMKKMMNEQKRLNEMLEKVLAE